MKRHLRCVECEQEEEPMLIFVGTIKYTDGTIKKLDKGTHPYCATCRSKLGISDELNPGRDLRAEARQVVLDAVQEARGHEKTRMQAHIIMRAVEPWAGGADQILAAIAGRRAPERPQSVFDGISDALHELDPSQMTVSASLALITTLHTVKARIGNWADFTRRTHMYYLVERPDSADRLLAGLL